MPANTDWFHGARWGVFMHFLGREDMSPEEWNSRVDGFDVQGLARQLKDVGAGYYFITIGQNSGHYCSPNATYDRLVGRCPSRLSRRDLVADLYEALHPLGIPLLVYSTSLAPFDDKVACEKLGCPFRDDGSIPPGERLGEFQTRWEAVIREWSLRWGERVRGWWIDGCTFADQMYRHSDPPNFQSFAAAMKVGNPQSLVAFNPGVRNPVVSLAEFEDYTAGEISNTLPTNGEEPCVIPVGRFVKGAQYHILTFLGGCWARGKPRFTDDFPAAYTRYVNSWGGVVTWDVPFTDRGLIAPTFEGQIRKIGQATKE